MTDAPADNVQLIDADIEHIMQQILRCKTLPPDTRALATTRLHYQLKLLEEARWAFARKAYPDAVKHILATVTQV